MEEKIFYPSKLKWLLVGIFGLFFLVASLLSNSASWYLILTGIFISASLMGLSAFHLIKNVTYLKVSNQGFIAKTPMSKKEYEWAKVSNFEVHTYKVNYASQHVVVFTSGQKQSFFSYRRLATKHDDYLPDNFGMKADELATILNEYRDAAIGSK
ncbi:MAG: hypothetical protein AB8B49_07100 [Nitratireductor sp.]